MKIENNKQQTNKQPLTLQKLIRSNPFGEYFANKKAKQIKKHSYRNHQFFNQYFNIAADLKTINKIPYFRPQCLIFQKNKLNMEKQLMYARNIIGNIVPDSLIEQILQQDKKQKGFIKNRRNKSLIIKNKLIYVQKWCLIQMELGQINNCNQQSNKKPQKMILCQFYGNQILGIKNYRSNNQGCNILIRFVRQIIIFNVEERKIIQKIDSEGQFIQTNQLNYSKKLEVLQFVNNQTHFYNTQQKNIKKHSFSELIHSFISMNKNQRIFASYQKLILKDLRKQKVETIFEIQSITKQRIYNFIQLKGELSFSPYLALAQSQNISLLDIRKPNSFVNRYYHMSQIAPPFILQYSDKQVPVKSNIQRQIRPFLLCYSPYDLGLPLMLNLDKTKQLDENSSIKFEYFQVLPTYPNRHADSMNYAIDCKQNMVIIFSIDNCGGLSYQKLAYDVNFNHYKFAHTPNSDKIQGQGSFLPHLSDLQWIQNQFVQKYFDEKDYNQRSKNYGQNFELDSEQKGKLSKKVNYANLHKFYSEVQKKGKNNGRLNQLQREQIFPNSLNSTLGSLNNQAQQNRDNQQLNPLSKLKENLINYKLFFDLKSQWQN